MVNLKFKNNLFLVLLLIISAIGIATKVDAVRRPDNSQMDYVPQNIGVYDTYYDNFFESDCRACHSSSTTERHHATDYAHIGNCQFCHFNSSHIERDCKVCHIDGGPVGDFGLPHHKSQIATSGMCNQCHFYVVEYNSIEPPLFAPSSTTPTPYSCENCHWPSGSTPHQPATYDGNTLNFLKDWSNWTGNPLPTTWPDGLSHPKPIEANGPVFSGTLSSKPYRPTEGTHHKLGTKVYNRCYFCHASAPDTFPDWNPNNPYLIRFCENCHDIGTLHSIKEHVTDDNIYRVSGIENQLVTANMKCLACHQNHMMEDLPPVLSDIPKISHLEPNFGPPGITINIYPASGICFSEDPVNGLCSFGTKEYGDEVKIGQKDAFGNWLWVNAPVEFWSEHLIRAKIPEQTFEPGKTVIRVYKEHLGTSNFKVFVMLHNPVINSLTPSSSYWGQDILVSGDGFPLLKEKVYYNGTAYGYSAYIELDSLEYDKKYRVTNYCRFNPWEQNKVIISLLDLLDVNTGNPVIEQDLFPGFWNLKIIIDYFKDNPTNGIQGKYNLGIDGLDPADELLYRVISNPILINIKSSQSEDPCNIPFIDSIFPERILNGGFLEIYGVNFGFTQGTSYVIGGNDNALIEILSNGKGNEDGICQKSEYIEDDCTLDPAKSRIIPIIKWSNTQIICDLPKLSAKLPLRSHIQVVVEGKYKSNVKKITIY
jgi:hypothetical protein